MAQNALRLRRTLSLSSAILSQTRLTPTTVNSLLQTLPQSSSPQTPAATFSAAVTHRHFHSSRTLSFSSASRSSFNDCDKIDPDTILFEGCDYKHWLIVMDFGKDPDQRPPPHQMVETYVHTAAQVIGSVEEAKKKIYACSTTTYTGFQVEVDEETSKKFDGLPGVIFVLPDSYIDPVNKEYGGDKYINGEIIPRPPPVQYGRTRRDFRPNDQRPRDSMPNQQGNPAYNQHGNPAYNQQGSMPRGGRGYPPQGPQQGFPQQQNFPSQQNYPPQQNFGPSGQADRGTSMPSGTHYPGVGRDGYQGGQRNIVPPPQGNYNHDYNHPQGQMSNRPGNHGGYAPPGQYRSDSGNYGYNNPQRQGGNLPGGHGGYAPPGQVGISGDNRSSFSSPVTEANHHGGHGGYAPPGQVGISGDNSSSFPSPVTEANHPGGHGGYAPPGQVRISGDNRSSFPSPVTGANGQTGAGSFEQSGYGQGPNGKLYGYGAYANLGENQRFPPTSNEQSNPMEHGNYSPGTQTGFNQGRY